jgi:hypothetical protein
MLLELELLNQITACTTPVLIHLEPSTKVLLLNPAQSFWKKSPKAKKHTTARIRWSSPTQLLIRRSSVYLGESGRDPELSKGYGRMCQFVEPLRYIQPTFLYLFPTARDFVTHLKNHRLQPGKTIHISSTQFPRWTSITSPQLETR